MIRCAFGAIVIFGAVGFTAPALRDDPIALNLHDPRAGDRVRVTEIVKESSVSIFAAGGNKQEKTEKKGRSVVYIEEVLTAGDPGKKPMKVKRTYEKYEINREARTDMGPLQGKIIAIEKKGDKYEFNYESGAAVEATALADLEREFNKASGTGKGYDLIPPKPVMTCDTWTLDKAKLLKEMSNLSGMTFDVDKASATAKLTKAYKKGGKQFGVIEMKLDAPIKSVPGKTPIAPKETSNVSMTYTTDLCVDGSDATASATVKGVYKVEATTGGVDVKVTVEVEQITKREPLSK